MNEKVTKTVEEVVKTSNKGKIGKRLLIVGGALAGLALGGWWLSKKSGSEELEDFDDDFEDFEEEEDTEDSVKESTEE